MVARRVAHPVRATQGCDHHCHHIDWSLFVRTGTGENTKKLLFPINMSLLYNVVQNKLDTCLKLTFLTMVQYH